MTMFIQSLPIFEVDVDLNDQSIRGSLLGTGIDPMLKRAITVWCIFWEFTMGSSFNNASIDVCSWSNGSTRCRCTLDTGGSLGSAQECLRCTTSHGVLPTLSPVFVSENLSKTLQPCVKLSASTSARPLIQGDIIKNHRLINQ